MPDPDGADRMIDRLGDLLRMTLNKSGIQEVSLKKSSTCSRMRGN